MSHLRLNGQERRAGILDAAIRLFAERGFRGTTTKELAALVGVSEPILYQHFSTKRDLYSAILEKMAGSAEAAIPEIFNIAPREGEDCAFLRHLAKGIITWHRENPAFVRLLFQSALENHEFHEELHNRYSRPFFDQLRLYFASRMEQGLFRKTDPTIPARAFIWLVAHYSLELTLFPKFHPPLPLEEMVDGVVDLFMKGIKA